MKSFKQYYITEKRIHPSERGYWISPQGEVIELPQGGTHIVDIVKNPEKYGQTEERLRKVYDKFGEPERYGKEGKSRDEIMLRLMRRGWIRVRKARAGGAFLWTVETIKFTNREKDAIFKFLNDKAGSDDVSITVLSRDGKRIENRLTSKNQLLEALTESSLSRIKSKLDDHACGTITAFRGSNTKKENMAKNKKLVAWLMSKGYSVTPIKGSYIENFKTKDQQEVGESSYFVCNHKVDGDDGGRLEKDLRKVGEMYDQDSILSIPYGKDAVLIGTSKRENSFPGYGKTMKVGKPKFGKTSGEFFSRVNGRVFAFESIDDDLEFPDTINGIRAMKTLAEEVESSLK